MSDIKPFEWFGHHKILRYVSIEAEVVNEEPLRVGAGKEASVFEPVDLVVLKMYDVARRTYIPVIPGSSWKGLFRAHAVRICRALGLEVCDGVPGSTCLRGNDFIDYERRNISLESKLDLLINATIRICLLDLIFGGPGFLSHVAFSDSLPVEDFKLGYRTMVALDRRTGVSSRRALFKVEYVEPGARFNFGITTKNLPNYALGLLAEILGDLNNGVIRVGGLKSRGFGRVKIENLVFRIREFGGEPLRALDPIDSSVEVASQKLEGKDAWELLNKLIDVWYGSLEKLRMVSENRWRWGVVLNEEAKSA